MSKRTQRRRWLGGDGLFFLCLSLLTVFFLTGIILGQVSAKDNPDAITTELRQYLMDYCLLDDGEERIGHFFLSALMVYFRYPLMAFFLGCLLPGTLVLPLIAAAFGFFLSYAACCFARAFGEIGVLLAAAVFGLRCLISIPCFFVLSVSALQRGICSIYDLLRGGGKRVQVQRLGLDWWLIACITAAVLLVGALSEVLLVPVFLRSVVGVL